MLDSTVGSHGSETGFAELQKKLVQFWEKFLKLVSTGLQETFWLKKTRKATEIHETGTAVELPSTGTITTIIVPSKNKSPTTSYCEHLSKWEMKM